MRRVGESVAAGGEQAGQSAGPKHVLVPVVGGFEAKQDAGERAVGAGHQHMTASARLEARGVGKGALALIEAFADVRPVRRCDERDRNRRSLAARKENRIESLDHGLS